MVGNIRIIDAIIIIAYFAAMGIIGVIAFRKNKTTDDYYVAGKTLGVFSLAAMWLSSWIGGSSIVGTSTDAYNLGIAGAWYVVILAIGTALFGLTFSRPAKRVGEKMQNITYSAMITSRYDQRSGSIVVICSFLAMLGFAASQFVALGSMMATLTGWNPGTCYIVSTVITVAYSAIGGLLAITYTTWIQFILIIVGTVVLGVPLAAHAMGGISQVSTLPKEYFNISAYGWSTTLALAVSSIGSFFTSMDSYTRCFAAKSEKASRRGALWAAVGVLFIAASATFIGLAAKVIMPELPEGTSAFAAIVSKYFPAGVSGIVMVGVFAAIMSTAVVSINMCSACITMDIYRDRINPKADDKKLKRLGIISSIVAGVVGALVAWWKYNIISLLLLAFTFTTATLFFPTVFGLFWKKPNRKASFVSMLCSLVVVIVWIVGEGTGWGPIFEVDALWPGLAVSAITFFGLTFFSKSSEEEKAKAAEFCDSVKE